MSASASPDPTSTLPPSRPGTSVGQVFAFVAGFVALAAVGAAIGWSVTKTPHLNAVGQTTSPLPQVSQSQTTSLPATLTPTVIAAGTPLPDFHQLGVTFYAARAQLSEMGVGTALVFDDQGSGVAVDHTMPPAGTMLQRGITVKIYVTGPAPLLAAVPDVIGQGCNEGGKALAAAGLRPAYPDGRLGMVTSTDPSPDDTQTRWNDPILVHCGVTPPPGGPSASATATPPTTSPSPNASS